MKFRHSIRMFGITQPPPNLVSQLMTSRISLHNLLKRVPTDHPEALKHKESFMSLLSGANPEEKEVFLKEFDSFKKHDDFSEAHKVAEDIKRKEDEKNRLAGYLNMKF